MANTVKASVILESISVISPGVGSMWEFTFWVDRMPLDAFQRVIKDGQTADFRKTLFAADLPAKQPKNVDIQVAIQELDPSRSDYGNGGTTIAIDTTFGRQERASFQAKVTERGGNKAGAVATLTFNLVSEVRGDTVCEDCDKELKDAAKLLDEFETVAGELLGITSGGTLASDFDAAFTAYDSARAAAIIASGDWDAGAKQLRDCAAQNPRQVKSACLRPLDRIETLNGELLNIASDVVPLLNVRADKLARRYEAFLAEERLELEIALEQAQLKARCEDNLDSIRDKLKAAQQAEKEASANVSAIAAAEQQAERACKKLLARFQRRLNARNTAVGALVSCAADSKNFGSCNAQAQALIVQDAQLGTNLIRLQLAYMNVDMLLERYNSDLSAVDDRLDLLVQNYTDALTEYTNCVTR